MYCPQVEACGLHIWRSTDARNAVTVDHIPVSAPGGIGVAGEQRQHIPPWLDQYFVDVVWLYDLDGRDLIGQCFPEICDIHFIAHFQKVYISKVGRAVPSPVGGDHAVGIHAADGEAGL